MDEATRALYPDLAERGGLAAALRAAFERVDSSLKVVGFRLCVTTRSGGRSSQVSIAARERLFTFDCWSRGVVLATGATPDLDRAALAVDRWVGSTCTTSEMAAAFDFVKVKDDAWAYERGVEVEERWRRYLETVPEWLPELAAVVREASARPELRRLFPYTSLDRLCFSRCTGYPFTRDVPWIRPARSGKYQVYERPEKLLGEGGAREAVDLVVARLPPGCGPATAGTADDLKARRARGGYND